MGNNSVTEEISVDQKKGFKWYIKSVGPAAILSMGIMGPGTMSSLITIGSGFAYTFFWAVLASVFFAVITIQLAGRITCVTSLNPVDVLTKHTARWVAWALAIINCCTQFFVCINQGRGFSSALTTLYSTASGKDGGLSLTFLFVIAGWIGVSALFYGFANKNVAVLKTIISSIVSFMLLCFVIVLFVAPIDWGQLFTGIIPTFKPRVPALLPDSKIIPSLAGVIGGATGLYVYMFHGFSLEQNKWNNKEHLNMQRWDGFFYNGILFGIFSVFLFVLSAAILYPIGTATTSVAGAATTLTPLFGKGSTYLFSIGWSCAVLTTMGCCGFTGITPIVYLLGKEVNLRNRVYRLFLSGFVFFSAVCISPFIKGGAIALLTKAMTTNNLVSPPAVLIFWYLSSSGKIMGKYKNGVAINIIMGILFILTCYLAAGSVKSIFS